ncbi:WS/DGAT domain-containing protein [Mycolicibacterium sp. 22603]|uniref:WS/DGAT domain-containing protein n=1 Tax=Mycolicibacterium sp. 22603 TaxID=3453950 RepID=UPI003F845943
MATDRMTAVDAQMFWMSAKIPNDTFLLYVFDGVPDDIDGAIAELIAAARTSADLSRRVRDESRWHYPDWVPATVEREYITTHPSGAWSDCLSAVVALVDDQLDARVLPWRIHLFVDVTDVPGIAGPATVAVLQITHALGGGGRTCAPAAVMFGRRAAVEPIRPRHGHPALLGWRSIEAARSHRELLRDGEMGRVPAPAAPRPPLRTNALPTGLRSMRTLVFDRTDLAGATVTVAALSAISAALAGQLSALGEDTSALGAEVTMTKPGPRRAYNHFGTVGVGLHPDLAVPPRRAAIAAELADRRARAAHPAMRAADRAFAATPAPLLRWGVSQFDPAVRPAAVTGNTVVSSVNCGPADFAFGGRPVRMAAAFPGLSPMVGLTHCVTGVGDTIAISVFAAESAVGDVDEYLERLGSAFS